MIRILDQVNYHHSLAHGEAQQGEQEEKKWREKKRQKKHSFEYVYLYVSVLSAQNRKDLCCCYSHDNRFLGHEGVWRAKER